MHRIRLDIGILARILTCAGFTFVFGLLAGRSAFAASCKVVHHAPPSEADTAFLGGDFGKAAELYQTAMKTSPADPDLTLGLVHSLLRQYKVQEAADALKASEGSAPELPALMTLRGEIELRQGEPWIAIKTALASNQQDPCNPRTMLLLFRLESLTSQNATARKMLTVAHRIDGEDPEIRAEWIRTLPVEQRIQEMDAYLAAPRGDNAHVKGEWQIELSHLKGWAAEPRKPCTMVSTAARVEAPLVPILSNSDKTIALGLSVKINNHAARLAIDTSYNARLGIDGVSGVLISRAIAQHSGLKATFDNDVPGTGSQKARSGFVAIADSISIGGVEFHDCAVQVMDVNFANGAEGIIDMDLFSNHLVTFDFPGKKLILEPLPQRPPEMAATSGLSDRYIAPEMKDYTPFLRSGTDLILPVSLDGKPPMPFVLDTAIGASAVSPAAAYELTTGRKDVKLENRENKANWNVVLLSGEAVLNFAGVSFKEMPIIPFDTSAFTDDSGMEISGMVGMKTLSRMAMHIDYRDGLLKFDYDPARKSPISF